MPHGALPVEWLPAEVQRIVVDAELSVVNSRIRFVRRYIVLVRRDKGPPQPLVVPRRRLKNLWFCYSHRDNRVVILLGWIRRRRVKIDVVAWTGGREHVRDVVQLAVGGIARGIAIVN